MKLSSQYYINASAKVYQNRKSRLSRGGIRL